MKWIDSYDSSKYIEEKDGWIEARGGDGTLIRAIHMHKDKGKPFFGIGAGTLNFLMNSEDIITEKCTFQKFYLIDVEVSFAKDNLILTETFQAFNDVILGQFNAWIEFDCKHEDNILGKFMGAAVLISTAQGSTGSNKNNHGTILPLSSKNWSVTGVQTNRNINYIIESTELNIRVKSRGKITLCIDGSHKIFEDVESIRLTRGESVEVIFNNIQNFKEKRQQN